MHMIKRLVESNLIRQVSLEEYRRRVRRIYDGPQGTLLWTLSMLSLHVPLNGRLIRSRQFDLRGARHILDVGSGAGQIAHHVLKYADPQAELVCFDLSQEMVRRARSRLGNGRPSFLVADLCRLPFASDSFDLVTCGYVLEHLPDPRPGLSEVARVLVPGGRMLLLTSEDTISGACTSRMWRCRTYSRQELRQTCHELGLLWIKELWFSRLHKMLRAGGICVEICKQETAPAAGGPRPAIEDAGGSHQANGDHQR